MEIRSQSKYIRITPRKARLVASSIRHLPIERALKTLDNLHKRAAIQIKKTIESGIANAENNAKLSRSNLYIKELFVDEGPRFKRWHAASRGMAHPYQKQSSHITVVLDELKGTVAKTLNKKLKPEILTEQKKIDVTIDKKSEKKKETYQTKMNKDMQKEMKSQQVAKKGTTPRKVIGK